MEAFGVKDKLTFFSLASSGTGSATIIEVGVSAAVPACAGQNPPSTQMGCPSPLAESPQSVEQKLGRAYSTSGDLIYAEGTSSATDNFREAYGGLVLQVS